jgi:hypothetical protein
MTALAAFPEVLTWGDNSAELRDPIRREFDVLCNEAYLRIAETLAISPVPRDHSADYSAAVRRVLRAPRTIRRLLWHDGSDDTRLGRYLASALSAERTLLNLDADEPYDGWTADGRALIHRDGSVESQPCVFGGRVVLDSCSPHARSLDLLGGSRRADPMRPVLEPPLRRQAVSRIEQACLGIASTNATVAECVTEWVRVVIPQPDMSGKFWSGTNGQYVGRVVLVNVHRDTVSDEEIVDAIVHEAIHGYMYMHESVEPWVNDRKLFTDEGAIVSPWSGTLLPVRPFIQACMVWYGLAMFWGAQLTDSVFPRQRVVPFLLRAVKGFQQVNLGDLLMPWHTKLNPELINVVDQLQANVHALLD